MASTNDSDSEPDYQEQPHFNMSSTNNTTDENTSSSTGSGSASAAEILEPPPKKIKSEWQKSYSHTSQNMMKKMGFVDNQGLGKSGQGRKEPVEAFQQVGRHGFGLKLESLAESREQWGTQSEQILIPEPIFWLKNNTTNLENISMDDLDMWVVRGPTKLTIDDEFRFSDPEILKNVLSSKSVFDDLNANDMRRARTRSNPFETIRGCIFLNRAAVKMANMDSLCDFMFTNPVDQNGVSLVRNDELLYFADICAGPGGFSEYILYRKKWEAKGFGFTLKGDNDFKLSEFNAASPETFDPYYGVKEDGNIFDPENQESFAKYVLKHTAAGVHIVMADGGFSVEGRENIQEILSKQLYLCQCLTALSILREKGHFVCKLFDLFTPFSVGLVYLMYKCFEEISICKPNTSRPANSERYLICKWKKPHAGTIERHLFAINQEMCIPNSSEDILELVDCDEIEHDKDFLNYLIESNNRIGQNQIVGLIKIAAFSRDQKLKELSQEECKQKCLQLWKLPDRIRKAPESLTNDALLSELMQEWKTQKGLLSTPPVELKSTEDLKKHISNSLYDWYFVPIDRKSLPETNIKTFFLCKARNFVQRYVGNDKWESLEFCIEIPPKTLIYGEIVVELIGEGRSQNKVYALHIIDGISLGGKDIRRLPLKERIKWCDKFARALNKPHKVIKSEEGSCSSVSPIRCKKLYSLQQFQTFFDQMNTYKLKNNTSRLGFRIRSDENQPQRFFVPGGLMFFNEINHPYVCVLSKSRNKLYYHNSRNNKSNFIDDLPDNIKSECFSSFRGCFTRRLTWIWEDINQVRQNVDNNSRQNEMLYRDDLDNYILQLIPR